VVKLLVYGRRTVEAIANLSADKNRPNAQGEISDYVGAELFGTASDRYDVPLTLTGVLFHEACQQALDPHGGTDVRALVRFSADDSASNAR